MRNIMAEGCPLLEELRWDSSHLQSQKILDLRGEDDDSDTTRESGYDWRRNELDDTTELRESHQHQDDACKHRNNDQSIDTKLLNNTVDHNDERAGRPTDLHAASTERGNNKSRY